MTAGRLGSRHRAHYSSEVTTRTGRGPRRPARASPHPPAGPRRRPFAAYAAAVAAFAYALVSAYWALGGQGLISTVGGYAAQFAERGGAAAMLLALGVAAAKAAGGLLALALVRPWGRVIPRGWLRPVQQGLARC